MLQVDMDDDTRMTGTKGIRGRVTMAEDRVGCASRGQDFGFILSEIESVEGFMARWDMFQLMF